MKKKSIISFLLILVCATFLSAAVNNEKAAKKPTVTKPATTRPHPTPKKEMGTPPQKKKALKIINLKQSKYSIRISYAMGLAGSDQSQTWSEPLYSENSEYGLTNKTGKSANINLGFGYSLSRAMGISLGAILHSSDLDATLNASVPSPWAFDSPRRASGTYASTLKSTILYLEFMYKFNFNNFSLGLFAGPAYFNSSTEVINAIALQDIFPNDSVTLSFTTEKVKKSSFGFSGGLNLNYFFSRKLGVFLEGRYLSGSATFTTTSQSIPGIKLTVGGMTAGAGLVFQF